MFLQPVEYCKFTFEKHDNNQGHLEATSKYGFSFFFHCIPHTSKYEVCWFAQLVFIFSRKFELQCRCTIAHLFHTLGCCQTCMKIFQTPTRTDHSVGGSGYLTGKQRGGFVDYHTAEPSLQKQQQILSCKGDWQQIQMRQ